MGGGGRCCTHLEFEVDGVFVRPEPRGEVVGEYEWGFRPEMVLALLDRHGLRSGESLDPRHGLYAVCRVPPMTRAEPTRAGPNADAVRNPLIRSSCEDAGRPKVLGDLRIAKIGLMLSNLMMIADALMLGKMGNVFTDHQLMTEYLNRGSFKATSV